MPDPDMRALAEDIERYLEDYPVPPGSTGGELPPPLPDFLKPMPIYPRTKFPFDPPGPPFLGPIFDPPPVRWFPSPGVFLAIDI